MATTVSHVYTVTANTTFNVQLIANNICGSDTATIPILVKPNPININIQVLNNQTSGCAPLTISLSNASSGATSYQWNFGDGNTLTTTTNGVVTHTYNTVGNYTVIIAATDGCAVDTLRIPVYSLPLPNINYTVPTNPVCIGDPVVFYNLSDTGMIYNWDFGDGYNSTLYSPFTCLYCCRYLYHHIDCYKTCSFRQWMFKVRLTKQVIVVSQLPGAFTLSDTAGKCLPFAVSFANQSLPSAQTTWDFGDGTTGTGTNTSHTYTQNGHYVVSMVSISPGGCTYVASKNISVTAPVGNFAFSTGYQCANVPLLFQSQAQYVADYVWDFGDGTVITTANAPVSHAYTTAGTYHPTLTIKNNDGCNVLVPVTDSIKIDKVVAAFTAQPLQTCLGSSTNFTNNSTAYFGMQQPQWNFGDGGSSSTTKSQSSLCSYWNLYCAIDCYSHFRL
jgi:PKD repeat protein